MDDDQRDAAKNDEGAAKPDADASLTRDNSYPFARQLGEDWQEEEPGIYRLRADPRQPSEDARGSLASRVRDRPQNGATEAPAKQETKHHRWWRRH